MPETTRVLEWAGPIKIGGQGRNSEGGSMGRPKVLGVSIEDAVSNFSRIDDAFPGGGLFGRSIVGGNFKLSD